MWIIATGPFDDIQSIMFLIGSIFIVIVIVVCLIAAGTESFRKDRKLDDRAKTAGKRLARWLDKKFPADDPEDGKN